MAPARALCGVAFDESPVGEQLSLDHAGYAEADGVERSPADTGLRSGLCAGLFSARGMEFPLSQSGPRLTAARAPVTLRRSSAPASSVQLRSHPSRRPPRRWPPQIGRASCREKGEISVVAVSL